jgi:AIPR protein
VERKLSTIEQLIEDIAAKQANDGSTHREAFTNLALPALEQSGDVTSPQAAYFERSFVGKTVIFDGYSVDPESGDVTLIVCDFYVDSGTGDLLNDDYIRKLSSQIATFLTYLERNEAYILANIDSSDPFRYCIESMRTVNKVDVRIITTRRASLRLTRAEGISTDKLKCNLHLYDREAVLGLIYAAEPEPIEIDFAREYGTIIPAMPAVKGEKISCWLAVIPAAILARIYEKYTNRVIEQNVRSFLQLRGSVNIGISKTLTTEPDMFFAYNNGIAATVEAIEFAPNSEETQIAAVRGLQIVNGGQTTATMHRVLLGRESRCLENAKVMAKITLINENCDAETAVQTVQNISRYSNSQNKVTDADFFSNHPVHRRLEQLSQSQWAPATDGTVRRQRWFYERTRGAYATMKAVNPSKASEYPASMVISKLELAKTYAVFNGDPHTYCLGAEKAFRAFSEYLAPKLAESDVVNVAWWRHRVAEHILISALTRAVGNAAWYEKGLRAQVVAYTVRLYLDSLKSADLHLNLDKIWQEQAVQSGLISALLEIASLVYVKLPQTGAAHNQYNPTEWAKKPACLKALKEVIKVSVPRESAWLISKQQMRAANRQQEVVVSWTHKTPAPAIRNAGKGFWQEVDGYVDREGCAMSEMSRSLLTAAAAGEPIEHDQAIVLLMAYDTLRHNGMRVTQDGNGVYCATFRPAQ